MVTEQVLVDMVTLGKVRFRLKYFKISCKIKEIIKTSTDSQSI